MTPVRERVDHLGDFTVEPRVLTLAAWAVPIGAAGAVAALILLRLIGLVTNLVFYQRLDTHLVAPGAGHHQLLLILLAPVAGGLIVGLMARFGSEKIRGHGMPEAIEATSCAAAGWTRASPCSSRCRRRSASAPAVRSAPRGRSS